MKTRKIKSTDIEIKQHNMFFNIIIVDDYNIGLWDTEDSKTKKMVLEKLADIVENYYYGQWSITNNYGYVDNHSDFCFISETEANNHADNYDVFHATKKLEIKNGKLRAILFDTDKIVCGKCE